MINEEILDKYIVVIPKENAALMHVLPKEVEKEHPCNKKYDFVLSLRESIEYVKNQKRELGYLVADMNQDIINYLKENEMNV